MKTRHLNKRLRKDRPMITISLRMPEDVVEDLKRIAPRLGFSGYQPLLRAYVGQGLRRDLEAIESIDLTFQGKRFLLRTEAEGTVGKVCQAVGVALPPTIKQLPATIARSADPGQEASRAPTSRAS